MIRVHAAPARSIRNVVVDNADASGGSMQMCIRDRIERGERKLTLDSLINITNCLGVTVDYLLQESIIQDQVPYKDIWTGLLSEATPKEQELVVNLTKLLLSYNDK